MPQPSWTRAALRTPPWTRLRATCQQEVCQLELEGLIAPADADEVSAPRGPTLLDLPARRLVRGALCAASWLAFFGAGFVAASVFEASFLEERGRAEQEWFPAAFERRDGKRRAYVTMAHAEKGEQSAPRLWSVVALARSVQQFSEYPLIVLTNHTHFPDGSSLRDGLALLNAEVRPVHALGLPSRYGLSDRFHVTYWKLQAWLLSDFDRVVWLDADSLAYRNIDWLFERPHVWTARDDWECKGGQDSVNTGIMSLQPSALNYRGLVQHAGVNPALSVHQVVATYFHDIGQPVKLLSDLEAGFGRCLDAEIPSPYLSPEGRNGRRTNGLWSVPHFIHKSGGYGSFDDSAHANLCFAIDTNRQRYFLGQSVLNVCHFHPLGAQWRALFCEAAKDALGLASAEVLAYCDDHCYFWGGGAAGPLCGGPVDGTPVFAEYFQRLTGIPGFDVRKTHDAMAAVLDA